MGINGNIGQVIFIGACITSFVVLCLSGILAYIRYVADIAPSKLNSVLVRHSSILLLFNVLVYIAVFGPTKPSILSAHISSSGSGASVHTEIARSFEVPGHYTENYAMAMEGKIARLEIDNSAGEELYVNIAHGPFDRLKVYSGERVHFEKINGSFSGGELRISTRKIPLFDRTSGPIYMNITSSGLRRIDIDGGANVYIGVLGPVLLNAGNINKSVIRCISSNVDCWFSGMGEISGSFIAQKLSVNASGALSCTLTGTAKQFNLDVQDAVKVSAHHLKSADARVKGEGEGRLSVYASKKLDVDLSGACRLTYYGEPTKINKRLSGMSKMEEGDPADLGVRQSSSGSSSRKSASIKVDNKGEKIKIEEQK